MPEDMIRCPACQLAAAPESRWCERCGQQLAAPPAAVAEATGRVPAGFWRSSTAASAPCAGCGSDASRDSYCDQCGQRRTASRDRAAIDLGVVAGATDRGRRRSRNEDAFAVGRLGGATAAVVCDGVASAPRSDQAAVAAAEAGIGALLGAVADGASPSAATEAAAHAAADAAAEVGRTTAVGRAQGDPARAAPGDPGPPSCTYVSALVSPGSVAIGWVGDSRAYWVGPGEARVLTIDDTLAGRLAADGVPADDERRQDPLAVALLCWLGADAEKVEPNVAVLEPTEPGLVVVCSDGLSRYLDSPADLLALRQRRDAMPDGRPTPSPAAFAATLVRHAVESGGADNIAVAVLPYPPSESPPPRPEPRRDAEPTATQGGLPI
ncbi:MAG: hypothetical protein GEU94_15065 [Micromonosporaceae bacterium]|nr:hypothetical protein [Micromonosporaceae bacterium]